MTTNEYRKDFPVIINNDIAYLDSGATSQKPQSVIDAESKYYETINSNPHRGAYSLSIESTKAYEDAREKVDDMCQKLLCNPIIHNYTINIIKMDLTCGCGCE